MSVLPHLEAAVDQGLIPDSQSIQISPHCLESMAELNHSGGSWQQCSFRSQELRVSNRLERRETCVVEQSIRRYER
jgi:hypothetical protein